MRWPWQKGRTDRAGDSPVAPEPASPPRPRAEWTALPPLRSTFVPDAPLVVPAAAFVDSLSLRRPLLHRPASVLPEPPPGQVVGRAITTDDGLTRPAPVPQAYGDASYAPPVVELPPWRPPVRTAPEPAPVEVSEPVTDVALDPVAAEPAAVDAGQPPPLPLPAIATGEQADESGDPEILPRRRRPNLGQSRRLGVDRTLLPVPAPEATPEPPAPEAPDGASTDAGRRFLAQLQDLARRAEPVSGGDDAVQPSETPDRPDRSAASSRRLGLGAPIPSVPVPEDHAPPVDAVPDRPASLPPPDADLPPVVVYRPSAASTEVRPLPVKPKAIVALPALPVEAAGTEAVPADVRDTLSRAYGVDVGDKPIQRGPTAGLHAQSLGARAFTRGGEVFLPAEEGPLDSPAARGLLAHELTHVAQQRLIGSGFPPEDSPAGHQLEEQARIAERYFRGDPGAPAPTADLIHPTPAAVPEPLDPSDYARQVADELVNQGLAHRDGLGMLIFGPEAGSLPTPEPVQRKSIFDTEPQRVESTGGFFKKMLADYKAEVESVWSPDKIARGKQTGGQVGAGLAKVEAPGPAPVPKPEPPKEPPSKEMLSGEQVKAKLEETTKDVKTQTTTAQEAATVAGQKAEEAHEHALASEFMATKGKSGQLPTGTRSSGPAPSGKNLPPVSTSAPASFTKTGDSGEAPQRPIESLGDLKAAFVGAWTENFLGRWGTDKIASGTQRSGGVGRGLAALDDAPDLPDAPAPPDAPAGKGAASLQAKAGTAAAAGAVVAAGALTSGVRPRISADDVEYNDRQLEELSNRIYMRLRSRLGTELRIDRERAGLLTDLR